MLISALLAGASVPVVVAVPLAERVPDVATRFCIDMVSRAVPVPSVGVEEEQVFARYGLVPGVSNVAMQALGPVGTSLLAGATLASGDASDGAFVVALGGAAGPTCRLIVYRAPADGLFLSAALKAMQSKARGWKTFPSPIQSPSAIRFTLLKRDQANKPYIANLLAPVAPGSVRLVVNVAAVPPTVAIPQGF